MNNEYKRIKNTSRNVDGLAKNFNNVNHHSKRVWKRLSIFGQPVDIELLGKC